MGRHSGWRRFGLRSSRRTGNVSMYPPLPLVRRFVAYAYGYVFMHSHHTRDTLQRKVLDSSLGFAAGVSARDSGRDSFIVIWGSSSR